MLAYAITPDSGTRENTMLRCRELIRAGVDYLQIREKSRTDIEILEMAEELVAEAEGGKTRILVNDRLDIAASAGADGVHLGGHSLPAAEISRHLPASMIMAVSCHNQDEVNAAVEARAEMITYSPVFKPRSKEHTGSTTGIETLASLVKSLQLPVFALGGISMQNMAGIADSGAAGIAAISLFFSDSTWQEAIETIHSL